MEIFSATKIAKEIWRNRRSSLAWNNLGSVAF